MNRRGVILCAVVGLLLAPLPFIGDLRHEVGLYVPLALLATLLLYLGYLWLRRWGIPVRSGLILGGALLLRALVFPIEPSLSDDAWRYLWDGRLVVNGLSPYEGPPSDERFASFHDQLYRAQGYPGTNTIYPPGIQLWFAAAASVSPMSTEGGALVGYYLWKLLLTLAELLAVLLLIRTLRALDRPILPVILYAWHPLAVMEIAGQGHTDALWVLSLVIACYGFVRAAPGGGFPGLGFGASVRLFPVLVMPIWLRYLSPRRRLIGLLGALPFLLLLAILLDPTILSRFGEVAVRFTDYYEFNGGIYYGVKALLDAWQIAPSNVIAGRITTGILLLAVVVITIWPITRRDFRSLLTRVLAIITLQIALTAKSHIWYGVAPLALVVLEGESRYRLLWLWLTLVAPLTYLYYAFEPNIEHPVVLWVEWGGAGLIWLAAEIRYRRAARPGGSPGV